MQAMQQAGMMPGGMPGFPGMMMGNGYPPGLGLGGPGMPQGFGPMGPGGPLHPPPSSSALGSMMSASAADHNRLSESLRKSSSVPSNLNPSNESSHNRSRDKHSPSPGAVSPLEVRRNESVGPVNVDKNRGGDHGKRNRSPEREKPSQKNGTSSKSGKFEQSPSKKSFPEENTKREMDGSEDGSGVSDEDLDVEGEGSPSPPPQRDEMSGNGKRGDGKCPESPRSGRSSASNSSSPKQDPRKNYYRVFIMLIERN